MSTDSSSQIKGNDSAERRRRFAELREEEWKTSRQLVALARGLLHRHLARPEARASVTEISRLLDLASRLGRLSVAPNEESDVPPAPNYDIEAALHKVYGPPLPGEDNPVSNPLPLHPPTQNDHEY